MKNKALLATAVATAVGGASAPALAATYTATLTQYATYSNNGTAGSNANITSSTATWTYDDVSNLVTQTGGTLNARFTTAPTSTLFRSIATGLVIGNGAAATGSTYACQEGNFGGGVGASICGNYNFGANFVNETTSSWGPGTATSRTLGGDDAALGAQQSIAALDGLNTITWTGTQLQITNRSCTGPCATLGAGAYNAGLLVTYTTQAVPLPATAWLLGTGLMGVAGRRFLRKKA